MFAALILVIEDHVCKEIKRFLEKCDVLSSTQNGLVTDIAIFRRYWKLFSATIQCISKESVCFRLVSKHGKEGVWYPKPFLAEAIFNAGSREPFFTLHKNFLENRPQLVWDCNARRIKVNLKARTWAIGIHFIARHIYHLREGYWFYNRSVGLLANVAQDCVSAGRYISECFRQWASIGHRLSLYL